MQSLADPGGATGAPTPNGIQFFHFYICFHKKVPMLDVNAPPQRLGVPLTGNPGSTTGNAAQQ